MGINVIPAKLKEELEDVKKVYDYGKHNVTSDKIKYELEELKSVWKK